MIAFIMYLNMLFRPLRILADKFNTLQMGMVASERVFKVLDSEEYMPDMGTHSAAGMKGEIKFENVWFAYTDECYVLKDISFHAQAGADDCAGGAYRSQGKPPSSASSTGLYEIQKGQHFHRRYAAGRL